MAFKYDLSSEALSDSILTERGSVYVKGHRWQCQQVVKWGGKDIVVTCKLYENTNSLADPKALSNVNMVCASFDKIMRAAFTSGTVQRDVFGNNPDSGAISHLTKPGIVQFNAIVGRRDDVEIWFKFRTTDTSTVYAYITLSPQGKVVYAETTD